MNDDELRARLQAADPARRDAPADSWIDELVEATVNEEENRAEEPRSRSRWLVPTVAAAAVAAIAVGGYAVVAGNGDGNTKDQATTELALTLPDPDPMAMCIQFSAEALSPAETAFSGTATDVTGDEVTLDVDHWYKGGDADLVQLTSPGDESVLLEGGIQFTEGERYLVSASDGTVSACGFSGPYTDEMAAAFDDAFGG